MHPSQNTNFVPRISIFHLDLPPILTDYCGKSIPFHTLIVTGLLARAFTIRRENVESLTIAVTYLHGFHAGIEIKYN